MKKNSQRIQTRKAQEAYKAKGDRKRYVPTGTDTSPEFERVLMMERHAKLKRMAERKERREKRRAESAPGPQHSKGQEAARRRNQSGGTQVRVYRDKTGTIIYPAAVAV